MFIKDETQVASRVGGRIERGVLDFGELFGESDEQEFRGLSNGTNVSDLE